MIRRLVLCLVFLGVFALYLFSSAPSLAPYRDMGEMVAVSHTLGVPHPPGYPAYALLGKIGSLLPFANASYRVNLLSVLGGALSSLFFFLLLEVLGISIGVSLLAAALWSAASGVWIISIVTEMYSLNLAAALFLLYLWFSGERRGLSARRVFLISFLFGLLLGVRLDIVLLGPAFFLGVVSAFWKSGRKNELPQLFSLSALFFAAGFSIYLFLPVRSLQKPLLNWNRPQTAERLWLTLSRKSHGGTLDLLSKEYQPGELFWTDFKIYMADAGRQMRWLVFPLALAGIWGLRRKGRRLLLLFAAGWFFTGPFFIYQANMPPNPHALAVLEPYFLLPNIFFLILAALGFEALLLSPLLKVSLPAAAALALAWNFGARWREVSKRHNFFGYDYARHIFQTLPRQAILIMQKDVQLFTFWADQYASGRRPDVAVVARGLAGSPWYIQMREEAGARVVLGPLRSGSDFENFVAANPGRRIFAGWDSDVPPSPLYGQIPRGLVREIAPKKGAREAAPDFFREIYAYRGLYCYQDQKEFFSSDLIDDYSKGHFALGTEFSREPSMLKQARGEWTRSIALNRENPSAFYRRAFSYFQENDLPRALADFTEAVRLYEKTYRLTREYHSLPDVVRGVKEEWADALVNLGVIYEKLGEREKSEFSYLKALETVPALPRAHYNLAVLYWNRDWQKAAMHLQETLRYDPGNREAQAFLQKALYALKVSGGR